MNFLSICTYEFNEFWTLLRILPMIMNRVLILLLTYFFVIYIKKLFFRLKKQEMSQLTLVVSIVLIIIIMSVVINCIMSNIPELLSEKFFIDKLLILY